MKIGRIETFVVPPRWLFVRIESDDGAIGWGEASLEGHAEAVEGAFEALKDRFIGHDPFRIEDIWQVAYRGGFYRGGRGFAIGAIRARSGAVGPEGQGGGPARLADARRQGPRPNPRLCLDRRRPPARRRRSLPGQEIAGLLGSEDECHRGAGLDRHAESFRRSDRPRHRRARGGDGTSASISMAASTGRWPSSSPRCWSRSACCSSRSRCCRRIPRGLKEIAALVSTPIALGERLYSRWDFKPFFAAGAVDIIQPDLSHAGGLSECRRIAAMAEAYDVAVAPHCPLGPLALAACLQLAATAPNVAIRRCRSASITIPAATIC